MKKISHYIFKNDLDRKRWKRFSQSKRYLWSLYMFFFICLFSITAELWVNDKPLVFKNSKGDLFFPALTTYHPSDFGMTGVYLEYKKHKDNKDLMSWSVWPLITWSPVENDLTLDVIPSPPSNIHLLGTDSHGRDVLARLLYGFRYSIGFALATWILSYILGIIFGAIVGFLGGKADLLGLRILEIMESVPVFFLLLIVIAIFEPSLIFLIAISAIFGWMGIAVYVRAEFLKLRKREFVEAARALGASRWRQISLHIFPNSLTPLITFSPFAIAGGVSTLASLDYLGFGLRAPTPSWGELLKQAQDYFSVAWWLAVYPSLALFTTLVILNFIGEGVREAFDPRSVVK